MPKQKASTSQNMQPWPIPDELCRELLLPHETVRDPVHGDIFLTALEREIIDTEAFQRLRAIMQLGPTHLVYPGAVHSRFLHSLGTLHAAETMVEVVNRNAQIYPDGQLVTVGAYPHLLTRLYALVHDMAHMPFGHALEDEGNLANGADEWKDANRAELWLGTDSEVHGRVVAFLRNLGVRKADAETVVQDLRDYVFHRRSEIGRLAYPYVADIVGNTLCADLLDYLERDMYFCGLRERSGDRVLKYMAILRLEGGDEEAREYTVMPVKGGKLKENTRDRVVLLAYRQERQHGPQAPFQVVEKQDVLSEAIDLLRRRFALAEKVFFHRTKIAGSAMLISAMAEASFGLEEIYKLTDDGLVQKLASDSNSRRAANLARQYLNRNLYKAPYYIDYREEQENDSDSKKLWRILYPTYRDPQARAELERELESLYSLPQGAVVVYCPEKDMNTKQFEMLVQTQPGGEVKQMKDILDPTRRAEMDAVNARFTKLWRMQILVDPSVVEPESKLAADFARMCEYMLDFENSKKDHPIEGDSAREQFAELAIQEYIAEYDVDEATVSVTERRELLGVTSERGLLNGTSIVKQMLETLSTRRESREQGASDLEQLLLESGKD